MCRTAENVITKHWREVAKLCLVKSQIKSIQALAEANSASLKDSRRRSTTSSFYLHIHCRILRPKYIPHSERKIKVLSGQASQIEKVSYFSEPFLCFLSYLIRSFFFFFLTTYNKVQNELKFQGYILLPPSGSVVCFLKVSG